MCAQHAAEADQVVPANLRQRREVPDGRPCPQRQVLFELVLIRAEPGFGRLRHVLKTGPTFVCDSVLELPLLEFALDSLDESVELLLVCPEVRDESAEGFEVPCWDCCVVGCCDCSLCTAPSAPLCVAPLELPLLFFDESDCDEFPESLCEESPLSEVPAARRAAV